MSQLNTRDTEGAKAFYGAVLGWETDTFDMGEGEITLWRVPGYVGGEPEQPVSREVVGVIAPMSSDQFPDDVPPHWNVNLGSTTPTRSPSERSSWAATPWSRPTTPQDPGRQSSPIPKASRSR